MSPSEIKAMYERLMKKPKPDNSTTIEFVSGTDVPEKIIDYCCFSGLRVSSRDPREIEKNLRFLVSNESEYLMCAGMVVIVKTTNPAIISQARLLGYVIDRHDGLILSTTYYHVLREYNRRIKDHKLWDDSLVSLVMRMISERYPAMSSVIRDVSIIRIEDEEYEATQV